MKRLLAIAAAEPLVAAKVVGSFLTVAAILGVDLSAEAQNSLIGLVLAGLAFTALVVRSATVSPATLATKVADAAYNAGMTTAARLDSDTAGAAGAMTETGRAVANDVVPDVTEETVAEVGGIAGTLARSAVPDTLAAGAPGPATAPRPPSDPPPEVVD